MNFLIADTFTTSLGKLTGDEQKAVKTTAFDLQTNPAQPGMKFHKLDRAKDKNFWSVRVNRDIRVIVHKTSASLLLCYVDHHDKAYAWAERRRLETHPRTGAAQLVEIRETVQKIFVPKYVEEEPVPKAVPPRLFDRTTDEELLGYGVPAEWLDDVRAATEDSLLTLVDHLPGEAAEALLELATGGKPRIPEPAASADPFAHPDAQRRFRVMTNIEELTRALEFPWDKWTVFLHPDQQQLVERNYNGPARVSGSAGTGKTIVALHRAVYLARQHPQSEVLLTTYSEALANNLKLRLTRLAGNDPDILKRIAVRSLPALALDLYERIWGTVTLADASEILSLLKEAANRRPECRFGLSFLMAEWRHVVDAWQLTTWEGYRDVARLGRKTRLPESQREILWSVFEDVLRRLQKNKLQTESMIFARLVEHFEGGATAPYDFAVVDEAQDLGIQQMRFFAALGDRRSNGLFFAGDLGQRIFQQPFSWKSLGVDIRGRSRTLRVNYRTSHQIRMQADRLLGPSLTDVDGINEDRSDTVSVFNGPLPIIQRFESEEEEITAVSSWLRERMNEGIQPDECGVFVRSEEQLDRALQATAEAEVSRTVLEANSAAASGQLSISTMNMAKGLEFRAVVVMACDDEVIPLQERIEQVGDDADLAEVYETERQLLYVACTRARDHLLVTSTEPASEFLDDLITG